MGTQHSACAELALGRQEEEPETKRKSSLVSFICNELVV